MPFCIRLLSDAIQFREYWKHYLDGVKVVFVRYQGDFPSVLPAKMSAADKSASVENGSKQPQGPADEEGEAEKEQAKKEKRNVGAAILIVVVVILLFLLAMLIALLVISDQKHRCLHREAERRRVDGE